MMTPLMRASSASGTNNHNRLWGIRLLHNLFGGLSVSHCAVWLFGFLFFPLMVYNLGTVAVIKLWLCPFLLMHYFVGTFSSHKRAQNSLYERVFPQLKAHFKVPVYKVCALIDELQQDVGSEFSKKIPRSMLSLHSWLETFMLDMLVKKNDLALYTWEILGMFAFLIW